MCIIDYHHGDDSHLVQVDNFVRVWNFLKSFHIHDFFCLRLCLCRNTINSFDFAPETQDFSFLRELSRTGAGGLGAAPLGGAASGRTGGAPKGEKKKPAKVWPEMGSLEWMVVKQVRVEQSPSREIPFLMGKFLRSRCMTF